MHTNYYFGHSSYGNGTGEYEFKQRITIYPLIGRELIIKEELVIYRADGEKWPGLSPYGDRVPDKESFKGKEIPFRDYAVKILGILPKGSRLKITRIKQEGSQTMSFIYPYVVIASSENKEFLGKELNAAGLRYPTEPLQFIPELVEWISP